MRRQDAYHIRKARWGGARAFSRRSEALAYGVDQLGGRARALHMSDGRAGPGLRLADVTAGSSVWLTFR